MSFQVKVKFLNEIKNYSGAELKPLENYLKWDLAGSSIIGFRGPCDVSFDKMVDGQDFKDQSSIRGSDMIHFIGEFFHMDLIGAVFLQRLMASIIQESIFALTDKKIFLRRSGDDLYLHDKKFSISIAAPAVNSVLIHFAVNISTKGTPVPTVGLEDFQIDGNIWGPKILEKFKVEIEDSFAATYKVKSL